MRSMLVKAALATIAAVVLMETPALPQVDTNSGNYMLPLCQAFLRMQSHDMATITNELSTGGAQSCFTGTAVNHRNPAPAISRA